MSQLHIENRITDLKRNIENYQGKLCLVKNKTDLRETTLVKIKDLEDTIQMAKKELYELEHANDGKLQTQIRIEKLKEAKLHGNAKASHQLSILEPVLEDLQFILSKINALSNKSN
jgi:hypothetical protein